MHKRQALVFSALLVFSSPHIVQAQVFSDDVTVSADVYSGGVYSSDVIIPPTETSFPTDASVPDGDYTFSGENPVSDEQKPSFLKDIFLGTSADRPIHPSTLKLFDILGKAQKGLQTYQNVKKVYDGIRGKNADSITEGVYSILAQYGIIDPQSAAVAASNPSNSRSTPILVGQSNKGPAYGMTGAVAFQLQPTEPAEWRMKATNENIVYKNAIQKAGDSIYSPEAQAILKAQDQVAEEARAATAAAAQGGIQSVLLTNQVANQAVYSGTVTGEHAANAQSSKSTQAVVKLQAKQNAEIASILAGNAYQLNAVNESMVRNTSALGNIVTTQSILVDKQTVSQYLSAAQLRQQGQIFTTLNNNHEHQRRKEAYTPLVQNESQSVLYFPGLVDPAATQTNPPSPQP